MLVEWLKGSLMPRWMYATWVIISNIVILSPSSDRIHGCINTGTLLATLLPGQMQAGFHNKWGYSWKQAARPNTATTSTLKDSFSNISHNARCTAVMLLCGWRVNAGLTHSTCGLNVWVAGKTMWSLVNTCLREEYYVKSTWWVHSTWLMQVSCHCSTRLLLIWLIFCRKICIFSLNGPLKSHGHEREPC